jgi:hypothetical protein
MLSEVSLTVSPALSASRLGSTLERLCLRLCSFPAVLIAGLALVTVFITSNQFDDPDLWWHLKVGQIIATSHSIPSTDRFSFTVQGHPWTAHEWLAQLSIWLSYAAGGPQALMAWLCVFASLIFILVYALCWMQSGDPFVSFLGALIAWFFATVGLAVRPLILGHFFLVIEMLLLELGRNKDRRWLWCLPPLFAFWANCHGTYIFGMAVLFIYWICSWADWRQGLMVSDENWDKQARNMLGIILLLCGGALCCNPVGIRLLVYPFDTILRLHQQSSGYSAVAEWMPPALRDVRTLVMLGIVTGVLLLTILRRSELRLRELLLVLMAFGMALQHARMMFLFGIIIAPVACRLLGPRLRKNRERPHPIANAALILVCLGGIGRGFPSLASLQGQVRRGSPVDAVEYIRLAGLSGPMLNDYDFGGYLIWALPSEKVFIDGRADIYDWAGIFAEYRRWVTLAEDPKAILDKYGIRFCILPKAAPMAQVIPYLTGWHKAYSDDLAVVFAR